MVMASAPGTGPARGSSGFVLAQPLYALALLPGLVMLALLLPPNATARAATR
jgi:hypothetical protein